MKGLIYNLLESLAQEAGCSSEVWELVSEFTAAELAVFGNQPEVSAFDEPGTSHTFDVPTQAMVGCLSQEANLRSGDDWDDCDHRWVDLGAGHGARSSDLWQPEGHLNAFDGATDDSHWMTSVGFGVESFREVSDCESEPARMISQHPFTRSTEDED